MIPFKLREKLNIKEKSPLKLEIENDKLVITKA
jgi:bifunctional DNA-binding transcriptional regulator/antitoxin component of YhaV-PrlF toxin-antitoxin module